jgi:Peptidase C39 family
MNPNWFGIASAILGLLVFRFSYRHASGMKMRRRILLSALASLMAIPALSFSAHYLHLVPEMGWYFQFRSISGTELLLVMIGVAGGFVASVLPRPLLVFPLLSVALLMSVPFIKPFIGPIPKGAIKDEWSDRVCLQSTFSTCGAASLATILKFHGVDAKEAELAAEAHSYTGGTEAWYLARCARSRGMDVRFAVSPGFDKDSPLPAMVGVTMGSNGHFLPILERKGDSFFAGDPLHGGEWLTLDDLNRRYRFTGFRMEVSRNGK